MRNLFDILFCTLVAIFLACTFFVKVRAEEPKPPVVQSLLPALCFPAEKIMEVFGESEVLFAGNVDTFAFPSAVVSYLREGVVHVFLTNPETGYQCMLYTYKEQPTL